MAWMTATVFFLITYWGPCRPLPPKAQLVYFEASGEDQDFYAGIMGADSRGLRHFPQLWFVRHCASASWPYKPGLLLDREVRRRRWPGRKSSETK